jgi:hypothetical protein
MAQAFIPGDNLLFQLESGFGLLRVLAVEGIGSATTWHLLCYEELFPDPETAEQALEHPELLHARKPYMVLTDRAFERTPAARLSHYSVTDDELRSYKAWQTSGERRVSDRSVIQLLGMR